MKKESRNVCDLLRARQYNSVVNFFEEPYLTREFHRLNIVDALPNLTESDRVLIDPRDSWEKSNDVTKLFCSYPFFEIKTLRFATNHSEFYWTFVICCWDSVHMEGETLNEDLCFEFLDIDDTLFFYLDHKFIRTNYRLRNGQRIFGVAIKSFWFKKRSMLNNKYVRYLY